MPRRTPLIASLSAAAAAVVLSSPSSSLCTAFHVSSRPTSHAFRPPVTALNSHGVRHSPLEDSPWESEPSYFDRLREAAKDPDTFEAFVAANSSNGNAEETRPGEAASRPPVGSDENDEAAPKPKKTGGYKRIEEWDEELRSQQDGSGMTWEEKVQFDGMRHGNGMRQNDILVHHLHSF